MLGLSVHSATNALNQAIIMLTYNPSSELKTCISHRTQTNFSEYETVNGYQRNCIHWKEQATINYTPRSHCKLSVCQRQKSQPDSSWPDLCVALK